MQKEIKQTWQFGVPPQEVWDYLTKPELLEQWLAKTDFKPVVGHKFQLLGKAGCLIYCEVLEVNPITQISYSWQTTSVNNNTSFDSKVVWTLVANDAGTELQLLHNGFIAMEDHAEHSRGWAFLVNRVLELLKPVEN